ncbi:MAG: TMEM43 family protein [Treponema sp.]|jgi:hypothetical protein|nr:TMEM43 family protein [Treponema sp.]
MAYQKKVTTSYGGRLKNSLGGIKTGAILFALGTIILFANEGNYVKTARAIGEAGKNVRLLADVSFVDQAFNGSLVHAVSRAETRDVLADNSFGVSETAVCLKRDVQYYQYRENVSRKTEDKAGGSEETTETYTYPAFWVPAPVDSSSFQDPAYKGKNTVLIQIENKIERAANVSFGAYRLPAFIIAAIDANSPANAALGSGEIAKNMATLTGKKLDEQLVHVQGNVVYFGKSSDSPAVGDVRVTFTQAKPTEVSIIAKVVGDTFEKYYAKNGMEISYVETGSHSAGNMIKKAESEHRVFTWILRLLGLILVVVGLKSVFGLLPALLKVLPFLGKIAGAGISLVCGVGGFAWSLLIIAIAWLFYRPLIALPMLAAAGVGIWFLVKKGKEKAASKASATQSAAAQSAASGAELPSAWDCECGHKGNTGKFCAECGKPQPPPPPVWDCPCGCKGNTGKFCAECGKPQPWDCECGHRGNTGKFCAECGKPQPI